MTTPTSAFTLCGYVSAWLDRYPDDKAASAVNTMAREAEAQRLSRFAGMTVLTQSDADDLVHWKFDTFPPRLTNALAGISPANWPHAERRIAEALQVAHACPGLDRPPLLIMSVTAMGVYGWGEAMSSAVLAACFPRRFTIGDTRALATVQMLADADLLGGATIPGGEDFAFRHWEPYLAACRWIGGSCRLSLREVDQALWAADGSTGLPPRASGGPPSGSPTPGPGSGYRTEAENARHQLDRSEHGEVQAFK